ncbi:acyl carrier protein [Paraneptunicella aestuarii]|uniref:acyl carrier protein n=1 Tax=Paraneptunicella aestuarii TaxID=2831148 RepID=UPI001E34021F|nr:acyl carrier protein [Paraneptunicella aestuarii]UAA37459.1 acyl carrier protein [Paraneptunicella aestuarii]
MTKDEIFAVIVENTRDVLPELEDHEFKMDDQLKDLGANSIDRSEIVMMTLEALSLNIPLIELGGVENIGELAETLAAKS